MKSHISVCLKTTISVCCAALCGLFLSAASVSAADASTVSAASDEKLTIYDLFSQWEENNAYPDWVASISSTDGSMDHMTVIVISEEGKDELLSMVSNPDDVQIFVDTQTYSYNALLAVQEEISETYMGEDSHIISCGLGWGTDADGNVIGFGESNSESRVIVTVEPEYLEQYTQEFEDLYQDMVYVESSDGASLDNDAVIAADDNDAGSDTDASGSDFIRSVITQVNPVSIIVFALGVFMMLVSIIIVKTGKRK